MSANHALLAAALLQHFAQPREARNEPAVVQFGIGWTARLRHVLAGVFAGIPIAR